MDGTALMRAVMLTDIQDPAHEPLAGFRAGGGRGNDTRDAMSHPGLMVRIPNNGGGARQRRSLGINGRAKLCGDLGPGVVLGVLGGKVPRVGYVVIDWPRDVKVLVARHYTMSE
jgi:hypothetical protein